MLPEGYMRSVCRYECGEVITRAFVHQSHPLYALEKEFCFDGEAVFRFKYSSVDKRKNALEDSKIMLECDGARISFLAEGQDDYKGELRVFLDRACDVSLGDGAVVLNEVSAFVFEQLKRPVSKEDVLAAMLNEFEVDEATASADLDVLLEQFVQMGLLDA